MAPDEPIDEHDEIDPANAAQVESVAQRLDTTPDELRQAVDAVGRHPVSVALYLNRSAYLNGLASSR